MLVRAALVWAAGVEGGKRLRAKACILSVNFPGTEPRPLVYSLAFAAWTAESL